MPFGKIERADVLLFALEAADLNLSPEAAALIHTEAKGIFRRVHNCVLSVESAARVAGVREVSADLVNSVLAGTSNVSNTRAGCKKARR